MHMFSFYLSSFCIHQRTKPRIVRLFHIDGILECTNKGKHCQTKNNLKESENLEWKRLANAFNRTNTLMLHISSWTIAEKNVNWNTSFRCSTYCWCNETNHLFFKQNYSVLDFSFTLYWFKTFFYGLNDLWNSKTVIVLPMHVEKQVMHLIFWEVYCGAENIILCSEYCTA